MIDAFKLQAGNSEPIWHEWYPPHTTVVDNKGKSWGASSAIKGNDGIFAPPLYIYFWYTYLFLNSDWLKSLKNKEKIGTLI